MEAPFGRYAATPAELKARLEAARDGEPYVVFRDGDGAQQIVQLAGRDRVSLGRREDNDVALGWDAEVSRLHAVLERIGGEWTVTDDGLSQNGTWVGEERISGRKRLRDGDVVRIGGVQVGFCDPGAGASGATVVGSAGPPPVDLTDAQRRVLVALCRPFAAETSFATPATNQDIAGELAYSVDAVKTHMKTLFRKFAIGDLPQNQKRLELVERAMRSGTVTPRDLR